jgi:site-specific DNA-methyltransferase (adenine-specific)
VSWKDSFPTQNRYFETDNGILYCGNCVDIMKTFPENSIDLVVTSPPYNVGVDYKDWNDKLSVKDYLAFVKEFLKGYARVLKDDGRFAINIPYDANMKHTGKPTKISLLCEYYSLLKETGLQYNTIIDLTEGRPQRVKLTAWGSWLSASNPYAYNAKEGVLLGYKKQWSKKNKGKSTMDKELFLEIVSGMWKYRAETRGITKANFSEDIPYKAIQGFSYEGDIILDSFMGSGTTAKVAEELHRRWIGIEISEEYCKATKDRVNAIPLKLFW